MGRKKKQIYMKKIFISGAHGSGCSIVKSLLTGINGLDHIRGTCHESWGHEKTINSDLVFFYHYYSRSNIIKMCDPDITIWIHINENSLKQICQRIVILDFLYTDDHVWLEKDWCWTKQKHARLAGQDWPEYSSNIFDYPTRCLDEMCQVAYERCMPWTKVGTNVTHVLDSNELFGKVEPLTLKKIFKELNCPVDWDFLNLWQNKNQTILDRYQSLFTWSPFWAIENDWQEKNLESVIYD